MGLGCGKQNQQASCCWSLKVSGLGDQAARMPSTLTDNGRHFRRGEHAASIRYPFDRIDKLHLVQANHLEATCLESVDNRGERVDHRDWACQPQGIVIAFGP